MTQINADFFIATEGTEWTEKADRSVFLCILCALCALCGFPDFYLRHLRIKYPCLNLIMIYLL